MIWSVSKVAELRRRLYKSFGLDCVLGLPKNVAILRASEVSFLFIFLSFFFVARATLTEATRATFP